MNSECLEVRYLVPLCMAMTGRRGGEQFSCPTGLYGSIETDNIYYVKYNVAKFAHFHRLFTHTHDICIIEPEPSSLKYYSDYLGWL